MDIEEVILVQKTVINFICDSNITIIINPSCPLHPSIDGVTFQIKHNYYIIEISGHINSKSERKWTLLHELGHVVDMHEGYLNQYPPKWMGKKIDFQLPWEYRPWEISADMWASTMWEALVNEPPPYIIWKK